MRLTHVIRWMLVPVVFVLVLLFFLFVLGITSSGACHSMEELLLWQVRETWTGVWLALLSYFGIMAVMIVAPSAKKQACAAAAVIWWLVTALPFEGNSYSWGARGAAVALAYLLCVETRDALRNPASRKERRHVKPG